MKEKVVFICTECGYEAPRWFGKCPGCGSWNSLTEEIIKPAAASSKTAQSKAESDDPVNINDLSAGSEIRYSTGIGEFDRVLGGGVVKGSLVLVGGDPGIGKSTLLLQMCRTLDKNATILYVTGEESQKQIKLRAQRLGVSNNNLYILAQTNAEVITATVERTLPSIVVIDSIQTMFLEGLSSSPGSVSQVRECTAQFLRMAKGLGIPVLIVGHVNKEGAIAGPKVMEHMVDAVLYFEGDRRLSYRILRTVKNRFGPTSEIGVFEMRNTGLSEVENPSALFLSGRPENVSGTCAACVMEGSRPLMAEIQALVSPTYFPSPRRMTDGIDYNRLCLLLAVLEKRVGLFYSNQDVYVNVAGGLRLDEPSTDLAVILSLASSVRDISIPEDTLIMGEVGLAGEIRPVDSIDRRLTEAQRLGFKTCIIPSRNKVTGSYEGMKILTVKSVREAINAALKG